ncbi:histidine phosphatase family protein, partial [Burkholderia multivorans]|nr:histidine phosphatase family protein [Burkholderia multivorans]
GESVAQFAARVAQRADAIARLGLPQWIVTHAGVIRAFASHVLRVPLDTLLARPVPTGGIVWLRADDGGDAWDVVQWDDA